MEITKRFDHVVALERVSFEVEAGQVLALLGHNGAGKSTLLRIIGTTVLPDAGTVRVHGRDLLSEPAMARRAIALMLGDDRSWYWRLTGRQNLEFFTVLHGLRRRDARERADQLLRDVALHDAADRRFDGYSAGMRARLSLARAMIAEPDLLLLDEPTQSLDAAAAERFRDTVQMLARERETAIVLVTHDLSEAAATADSVLVLRRGQVAHHARRRVTTEELEFLVKEAAS